MEQQNYANHRQIVPVFHYFLMPLAFLSFAAAGIGLVMSFAAGEAAMLSVLILILTFLSLMSLFVTRLFALKAQDRAIKAEENLRHFVLTGRLLEPRLSIRQIVALRFAGDPEFPGLCKKALAENWSPDQIKRSIQEWKADLYRV